VKSDKFVKNAAGADERRRFGDVVAFFRKYGDQYDMDHLLMMAQGFQESALDHSVRSPVGAIGVMQVMPATGKELKVGDVTQLEANVHAGVKYMRFMMDRYYKDEPMTPLNKGLFTFASYNAGPARIASLRKRREARPRSQQVVPPRRARGGRQIGPETVTYVANIYKYYTAYKLLETRKRSAGRRASRCRRRKRTDGAVRQRRGGRDGSSAIISGFCAIFVRSRGAAAMELAKSFEPHAIEAKWYPFWESKGMFKPSMRPDAAPFCIQLPPPNVTGTLHMGTRSSRR